MMVKCFVVVICVNKDQQLQAIHFLEQQQWKMLFKQILNGKKRNDVDFILDLPSIY